MPKKCENVNFWKGITMNYPKAEMSISELVKLGYSKTDLMQAAHHGLNDYKHYARKTSGGGKWVFDTEKFEKNKRYIFNR